MKLSLHSKTVVLISVAWLVQACAPAPRDFASSTNVGVIGGTVVKSTDAVSKSTVMILTLIGVSQTSSGVSARAGLFCTGTIIASDLVLTAAHCLTGQPQMKNNGKVLPNLRAVVFTDNFNLKTDLATAKLQMFDAADAGTHPKYVNTTNASLQTFDIGLIRLKEKLPDGYAPAEILSDWSQLDQAKSVSFAGYGTPSGVSDQAPKILRTAELPVFTASDSTAHRLVLKDQTGPHAINGSGGDSGGPGFITVDGKTLLVGEQISGNASVSIFERLDQFRDWIKSAAKDLKSPATFNF